VAVEPEYASVDEAAVALEQLRPADMLRLEKISQNRLRGLNTEWKDLLQETLTRILEGTRPWPRHVPIIAFIAGVMKSLASEYWKHQAHSIAELATSSNNPGPEGAIEAKAALKSVEMLFNDDDQGLAVVMAKAEGYSPEEIQEMFSFTQTQYDSTLRRIRRRLNEYKMNGAKQ